MKAAVDENKCIACGTCEGICPQCFKLGDKTAEVIKDDCTECDLNDVAQNCPVGAISVSE